ncbi:unnamed protein product [Durusdinium trenchii]|uniref:Uncharacterized protein n=1 Tax=Durusdinium trenchii TaxID=1381693 RepID=A0ABP0S8N2_9DINO
MWPSLAVSLIALQLNHLQSQDASGIREVYLEQSIGVSIPLFWRASRVTYSLALPRDTELVAVRLDATQETGSIEPFALHVPDKGLSTTLTPGVPSHYVEVPMGQPIQLRLDIRQLSYEISLVRSRIGFYGQGIWPDPAQLYPPEGTLAGLNLWDSMGTPAIMVWFMPRVSMYFASLREEAHGVRLAASPNDPDALVEWRINAETWQPLVPGRTSEVGEVAPYGWTLLEVRVSSSLVKTLSPLLYEVVLARGSVCHPTCASCWGPSKTQCESCNAPLVLVDSKCLYTSCSSSSLYFNQSMESCQPCDSSCLECADGSPKGCLRCPPSRYLRPASSVAVVGSCEQSCLAGFFVQPSSQRCQMAPADVQVERFYLRLTLRISVEDFLANAGTLKEVLRKSAETLAVSSEDVRFHRWDSAKEGLGVFFFLEVENPFVQHQKSEEWFSIDDWFSSLPVPVDEIRIMTQNQLYPPGAPDLQAPFLDAWTWGFIGAGAASLLLIYPLYSFYFVRKYRQQYPYQSGEGQELFVDEILDRSDHAVLTAMSQAGNLKVAAGDDG